MLIALGPGQPIPAINSHVTRSSSSFSECDSYPVTRIWIPLYFIFIFKVHQSYTVDNYCTTPVQTTFQPAPLWLDNKTFYTTGLMHFLIRSKVAAISSFVSSQVCTKIADKRNGLFSTSFSTLFLSLSFGMIVKKLESDKMIHMLGCPICQVLFVQHTHLDFQRIEKSFFISWFHDYESYVLSRVLIV